MARGSIRWKGNSCELAIPIPGEKTAKGYPKYHYDYLLLGRDGKTRAEVERIARARLAELQLEFYHRTYTGKHTVGEAVESWLHYQEEKHAAGKLADGSLAWYKERVNLHINPAEVLHNGRLTRFIAIPLKDVRPTTISRVYMCLYKKGLSESSVSGVHRTLKAIFNYARGEGWLVNNPVTLLQPHEIPSPDGAEHPVLDVEGVQRFLAAAKHRRIRRIALVVLFTGLRISEVLGLKREDLDFERLVIRVRRQLKHSGPQWATGKTKSKHGVRVIPMDPFLAEELQKELALRDQDKAKAGTEYTDAGFVFATALGRPLNRHNVSGREFKRVLADAGLEDMREHDLRGTFATLINELDGDTKTLAALLGQADDFVAKKHYIRSTMASKRRAIQKLAKTLRRPR